MNPIMFWQIIGLAMVILVVLPITFIAILSAKKDRNDLMLRKKHQGPHD